MSYQQKKVPSSLADLGVSGDILVNKGNIDCSTNPNYPAATAGDTYIVSVAGKIGGASGTDVDIKDMIVCKTTAIAGTQAAVGSSWFVLDGDDDLTLQILGTLINSATDKATPVDADHVGLMDSAAGNIIKKLSWLNIKATLKTYFDTLYAAALGADDNYVTDTEKANLHAPGSDNQDLSGYQLTSAKDATGGYAGLTLFKINFKNAANTFTNFLTNATTAARTYTFPDKDGTVAMTSDITSGAAGTLGNLKAFGSTPLDRWLTSPTTNAGMSTSSAGNGLMIFTPFFVAESMTFDRFGVSVDTGAGAVRCGIYTNVAGYPTTLVLDSGEITTSTSGVKTATINQVLSAGVYWLAYTANGTPPTINVAAIADLGLLGFASSLTGSPAMTWEADFTYAALPSTAPTTNRAVGTRGAGVFLRRSA